MAAVMTTGVILPPNWLIMKKAAIPAEIAIIATFMKQDPEVSFIMLLKIAEFVFTKQNSWEVRSYKTPAPVTDIFWSFFVSCLATRHEKSRHF